MKPAARIVACPKCSKPVEWTAASVWRPFCSKRCKMVDLGAWASERYRVPAVEDGDQQTTPPDGAEQRDS